MAEYLSSPFNIDVRFQIKWFFGIFSDNILFVTTTASNSFSLLFWLFFFADVYASTSLDLINWSSQCLKFKFSKNCTMCVKNMAFRCVGAVFVCMSTTALCAHHVCLYITTTRRWLCEIHNENPTAQRTNDNRVCLSIHEWVRACLCACERKREREHTVRCDVVVGIGGSGGGVVAAVLSRLLLRPFYIPCRILYSHTNTVCN